MTPVVIGGCLAIRRLIVERCFAAGAPTFATCARTSVATQGGGFAPPPECKPKATIFAHFGDLLRGWLGHVVGIFRSRRRFEGVDAAAAAVPAAPTTAAIRLY
jgi:hypothetical protein